MRITLTMLMLLTASILNARQTVPFSQLRSMVDAAPSQEVDMHVNKTFAAPGTIRHSVEITEDLFVEGYALTEPDKPNRINENSNWEIASNESNSTRLSRKD